MNLLTLWRVIVSRCRAAMRRDALDRDFEAELAAHLAMAEDEKVRQGMSRAEARRAARLELGGLTQLREAGRDARGLPWLDRFGLDFKLSLRKLRKSWGLTLVGGLAMTVAISIGVFVFWFVDMLFYPSLPLDQGDRVVAIQTWSDKASRRMATATVDFERWRDDLHSIADVGAFQTAERNLVVEGDLAEPVMVAEMSAAGFRVARVAPHLGRPLLDSDEPASAPDVAVIGWQVWQSRFAADPQIIGRTIHLGSRAHTVIGVMPRGFAFPISHQVWIPLRGARSTLGTSGDADGTLFGRLAPGVSLATAQAEVAALGIRGADEAQRAELELRGRVVPYTFAFTGDIELGDAPWVVRIILFLLIVLLVPPCANIAILVYARTITRQEEFAARFALGASRGRIVLQLFIEILVLAVGAATIAVMAVAGVGVYLRRVVDRSVEGVPFWIDFSLSWRIALFAAVLALAAATIAGAVPAIQATGRRMQSSFRALGSRSGAQLGKTWTALVIVQVALTLAALPSAIEMGWGTIRKGVLGPGFAAESYLTARLALDPESAPGDRPGAGSPAERFAVLRAEWGRRLATEPGVLGLTQSSTVPGDEPWAKIEVDDVLQADGNRRSVRYLARVNHVDAAFFDTFDGRLLVGRALIDHSGEATAEARSNERGVLVNQTFVRQVLGDTPPLGHRLRYPPRSDAPVSPQPARWYEIVGVVADLPANPSGGTIYHPMSHGTHLAATVALRTGVEPTGLSQRLRESANALDPNLRVEAVAALDAIYRDQQVGNNVGAFSLAMVTFSVLLLSAAGIYALMAFTVNQRRREISIRSALGAQPHRVLAAIFRRAGFQIGVGAALGTLIAVAIDRVLPIEQAGGWNVPWVLPATILLMLVVGLLATYGPARRGLGVDPNDALREG